MSILGKKLKSIDELSEYGLKIIKKEETVSNNLKEVLKRNNLNQSELAKLIGIPRQTVSDIINCKYRPSIEIALKISVVLNTNVTDLFQLTDTAWYTLAKEDNLTLYIDKYTLEIVNSDIIKNILAKDDREYIHISNNELLSKKELNSKNNLFYEKRFVKLYKKVNI